MSDYVSKKAIRYRLNVKTEEEKDYFWNKIFSDYNFRNDYGLKHDMKYERGYDEYYLDIPIKETYGSISGDFGESRMLTEDEIKEYLDDFEKVIPEVTPSDLRHVFYCYYNGVDSPDCYEVGEWIRD